MSGHLYRALDAGFRNVIDHWISEKRGSLATFTTADLNRLRDSLARQCKEDPELCRLMVAAFDGMQAGSITLQ